jgi:hypothetical protein
MNFNPNKVSIGEVLIVVFFFVLIGFCGAIVVTVCTGNMWFFEKGVLKELQVDHPRVTEIITTRREVFKRSVIIVEENEQRRTYYLDTSILFNYEFFTSEE